MIEMYIVYTVPRPCVRVGARDAQASSTVCSRAGRSVAPFQFQFPKAFSRVSIAEYFPFYKQDLPRIGRTTHTMVRKTLPASMGLCLELAVPGISHPFPIPKAFSRVSVAEYFPLCKRNRRGRLTSYYPYIVQEDHPGVNGTLPRIGSASSQRVTSTVSNFAASRHIPAAR